MNSRCFLLAMALAWAAPLAAQSPAGEPSGTLAAINQARSRGCEGRPGRPAPLSFDARLSRAAERVARGQELQAALSAEGYKMLRAGVLSLQGYSSGADLAQGLARHACERLLDPAWRQAGLHQRGSHSWVVLADPFSPPQVQDMAQVRAEVLQRVNQARAVARRCGDQDLASAAPLKPSATLNDTAQEHASDMARHSYFSHTGRDGSQVGERARRSGYAWQRVGENLAAGQATPAEAVQGWLDSPGHCANLMHPAFTEMGLAFALSPQSREGIYWVQVLGTPR